MQIIETHIPSEQQKEFIFNLWNREYPKQLKYKSSEELDNYLQALYNKEHLFLTDPDNKILGWCFSFERNKARWFAIIVDQSVKRKGYGTQLLGILKQKNNTLSGWVIDHNNYLKANGEFYQSPLQFYIKNDFIVYATVRLETDTLSAIKIEWRHTGL